VGKVSSLLAHNGVEFIRRYKARRSDPGDDSVRKEVTCLGVALQKFSETRRHCSFVFFELIRDTGRKWGVSPSVPRQKEQLELLALQWQHPYRPPPATRVALIGTRGDSLGRSNLTPVKDRGEGQGHQKAPNTHSGSERNERQAHGASATAPNEEQ
jgi:hypothetical protein